MMHLYMVSCLRNASAHMVLILVVMDDALVPPTAKDGQGGGEQGLNPCCNG